MEPNEYHTMRAAEDHHWWYVGLHDLACKLLQREAGRLRRPLDILDAGCGTGRLCELMQPFGHVNGCDIHPLALDATSRRGIGRVLRRDLANDDLGTGQYDLITCMDVLCHQAITDGPAALRNLHRALREGGLLILHLPAFELLRGAHDRAVHTRYRFRRDDIIQFLQAAGFAVEFASYRLLLCFLPLLLWRAFTRIVPLRDREGTPRSDLAVSSSRRTNQWLIRCVKAENRLLTLPVPLPFGTSVFATARK